ncbi:MAG: OmpH family outer membrane protein [Gammaproteobacteria bacterium]|nr:OmpH family outer membrane protein [Gammaproteobacteria bacterium]
MKFKKLIITAVCLLAPLSAMAEKSAYINSAVILQQAPQTIEANQVLQDEFKNRELDLKAQAAEIRSSEEKYKKDSTIMSDAQKKKAEENIIAKVRAFKMTEQSFKEDLNRRRTGMIKDLQSTLKSVIQGYGKKHGYDFIFSEGVAYASDSVDITNQILAELKK